MANQAKDIAVFTNGEIIGDGIVKLPFITALRIAMRSDKEFSQDRLVWFCSDKSVYNNIMHELVEDYIDEIILLPSRKMSFSDYLYPTKADDRKFKLLIDTQMSPPRTLWLKRKFKYEDFISPSCNYLFSDKKPSLNSSANEKSSKLIDMLMTLGSLAMGRKLTAEPVTLKNPKWQEKARQMLAPNNKYVGFVPGAGQLHKRWHVDNYINLARFVQEKGFVPVIFTGPAESDINILFKENLEKVVIPFENADIEKDSDAFSPCFTIALAQYLNAVVANDGGGGNLVFAADKVPAIGIYRSGSVIRKYAHSRENFHGFCPENHGGNTINDIPLPAVKEKLAEIL